MLSRSVFCFLMLSSGLRQTGPEPTTNKRMKKKDLLDREVNTLLPRYLFSGISSLRRETKLIWARQSYWWWWLFGHSEFIQLFCDPMDCSPSGSSVYGISQARILEWVAISFSKGSSLPRDWTWVSCIAGLFLLVMDREAWHAAVHGVTKSWTRLSNWTEPKWTELLGKHAVYWCRWIIFSKSKKFKKTLKILLATKEYCRLHWNGLRVHA